MFVAPLFWNSKTFTCIVPELFNVLFKPLKVKLLLPVLPAFKRPFDWILVVRLALIFMDWINCNVPPISNVMLSPAAEITLYAMVTVTPGATHILLLFSNVTSPRVVLVVKQTVLLAGNV